MSEPVSDQRIIVTGEERTHPAIRKLARAMIALAKLKVGQPGPAPDGDTPAVGPERTHD
jgi:hypothetical protein